MEWREREQGGAKGRRRYEKEKIKMVKMVVILLNLVDILLVMPRLHADRSVFRKFYTFTLLVLTSLSAALKILLLYFTVLCVSRNSPNSVS